MTPPAIAGILDRLVGELPATTRSAAGPAMTWAVGDRAFAIVDGDAVELRLDPAVAAAAMRTPDVGASERGPEWVRFAPRTLEGHDLDRLEAWFALAHRRATATGPSR